MPSKVSDVINSESLKDLEIDVNVYDTSLPKFENLYVDATLTEDKKPNDTESEVDMRLQEEANNIAKDSAKEFMECMSNIFTEKINVK